MSSRLPRLAPIALAGSLLATPSAHAGYGCPAFWAAMPQVESLAVKDGRVAVTRAVEVQAVGPTCPVPVPAVQLSVKELAALRRDLEIEPGDEEWIEIEQLPNACTRADTKVYFGLNFYQGEGTTGAGGVGRLDPDTKQVELHRPAALLGSSVREIARVDSQLWLATENRVEGTRRPGIGLARYDWAVDRLDRMDGPDRGPCGMWINDLLVHEGELWVATELGVSRHVLNGSGWRHFAPDADAPGGLREASCSEIAQKVALALPDRRQDMEGFCDLDGNTPRDTFRSLLREFRPQVAETLRWSD